MRTITEIKVQKRDKNKVNLSLDGEFFGVLSLETAVKNGLKKGSILDEKVLERIVIESNKKIAYEKAINYVSKHFKSQREVERYLYEKEYNSEVVFYVIKKMREYGFIDDEKFCESFIAHHKQKDGYNKIKEQLKIKGIDEKIILSCLEEQEGQLDLIIACKEKYMRNKEETKENYAKLYRYLVGKGFKIDEILKVLKGELE